MKKAAVPAGAIVILLLLVLSGCATMTSTRAPGADLSKIRTIYVIKLDADGRGINKVIADELSLLGYQTTTGLERDIPQGVDATFTYQDRWMWDIAMYMLRLNIQVRDAKTGALLAEGESYRPSLQRKEPNEMAREVLKAMLKGAQ